jgi:hypothetical protein
MTAILHQPSLCTRLKALRETTSTNLPLLT